MINESLLLWGGFTLFIAAMLALDLPGEQNLALVRETSFSRYPLMENESARPVGGLHVKDLFLHADGTPPDPARLRQLARPAPRCGKTCPSTTPSRGFSGRFTTLRWSMTPKASGAASLPLKL